MRSISLVIVFLAMTFTALVTCAWAEEIPLIEVETDISAKVRKKIDILSSTNAKERGMAAYRLGEMGEKAENAIPHLIGLLSDHNRLPWEVGSISTEGCSCTMSSPGEEASVALGKIGVKALPELFEAIADDDLQVRNNVVSALGMIADSRSTELLIPMLKSEYPSIIHSARQALVAIGAKDLTPLLAHFNSKNTVECLYLIDVLKRIGDERAIETLKTLAMDEEPEVAKYATEALRIIQMEAEHKSLKRLGEMVAAMALKE